VTYESFDAKLRDELLNGEVFFTLKEASIVIEPWRRHDNSIRPHSSLSDQPPAPGVILWPTEPNGSAPTARPAIVTRPTMHELRTWTTR
jgi:putative transposase